MGFFDARHALKVHILYGILVVAAIGLSVPRLFMNNQPRTRANTIALGMGAKSLIILMYILLTEHCRKLHRYASLKANMILSGLEIVFWAAVVFLILQANIKRCVGVGCGLSWAVAGIGIILSNLAVYLTIVAYQEFRKHRRPQQLEMIATPSQNSSNNQPTTYIREVRNTKLEDL